MRGLGHVMDKFETCVCFLGKYEILVSNYIQRNQLLHSNISEIIFLYFFFLLVCFPVFILIIVARKKLLQQKPETITHHNNQVLLIFNWEM